MGRTVVDYEPGVIRRTSVCTEEIRGEVRQLAARDLTAASLANDYISQSYNVIVTRDGINLRATARLITICE